jgi:hypothetical protein
MPDVLSTVQATFDSLDAQYNLLRAACKTAEQLTALEEQYAAAQKAYQMCIGKILSDDDPLVAALSAQLKAANEKVKQSVVEMDNISKVIDEITTAVTIGAKLVSMTSFKP